MLDRKQLNWKEVELYKQIPVITAKTNSGKTTFAVKELRKEIEALTSKNFDYYMVLTPYTSNKNQTLNDKRFRNDITSFTYDLVVPNATQETRETRVDKTIFTTYAALATFLKDNELPPERTCLVLDELPTLLQFSTWQKNLSPLITWLIDNRGKYFVVGMTGTPQILEYCNQNHFCNFKFVDITPETPETLSAGQGLFIQSGSAVTYAKKLICDGFNRSKLFYVETPAQAYTVKCLFTEAGYEAGFTCSVYNDTIEPESGKTYSELMKEQIYDYLPLNEYITEHSDIPETLDVLVINAASRDGLNILDKENRIDETVIQSACRMTIEQARARVRHDIEKVTVIYNKENEKRSVRNFDSANNFYRMYNACRTERDRNSLLATRYFLQESVAQQTENYKRGICKTKPECLDLISIYNEKTNKYSLNPFIPALLEYERENFLFSDNRTTITIGDRRMLTMKEFIQSLSNLTSDKEFQYVNGRKLSAQVRVETTLNNLDLGFLFSIEPGETRTLTSSELKQIIKQNSIKRENGHPASIPSFTEMIKENARITALGKKQIRGHRTNWYEVELYK